MYYERSRHFSVGMKWHDVKNKTWRRRSFQFSFFSSSVQENVPCFGLYNKKNWLFPTRRRRTSSNAPVASSLHPISIIHRFFFQKSSDTSRMGSRNQEISQHSGRPSTTRMLATRKSFKWWRDAGWRIPTSDPISLCWKPRSAVSTSNETPVANGLQCYTTWKRKQRSAQLFIHQFLSVSRIVATAGI